MNPVLSTGLATWLLIGFWVGLALHRGGHETMTAALAVPCWPLFVHTLVEAAPPKDHRILTSLERLARAADNAGVSLDLDPLARSLADAEQRLGRLDVLLLDDPEEAALLTRRARANAALEAALGDLAGIRLQLTLMTVDRPDASSSKDTTRALDDLRARLRVAQEIS